MFSLKFPCSAKRVLENSCNYDWFIVKGLKKIVIINPWSFLVRGTTLSQNVMKESQTLNFIPSSFCQEGVSTSSHDFILINFCRWRFSKPELLHKRSSSAGQAHTPWFSYAVVQPPLALQVSKKDGSGSLLVTFLHPCATNLARVQDWGQLPRPSWALQWDWRV